MLLIYVVSIVLYINYIYDKNQLKMNILRLVVVTKIFYNFVVKLLAGEGCWPNFNKIYLKVVLFWTVLLHIVFIVLLEVSFRKLSWEVYITLNTFSLWKYQILFSSTFYLISDIYLTVKDLNAKIFQQMIFKRRAKRVIMFIL